jgi:hypothetical protein
MGLMTTSDHAMTLGRHHLLLIVAAMVIAIVLAWPHPLERGRHLPVAQRLPETARAALRTQMRAHARGMMALVSTVTVLDYDGAAESASELLAEPRVARPLAHDAADLNASLPARFFSLQDELRAHLEEIRRAARARDPDALASAFAAATRACVGCHDAYLRGQ